MEAVKDRGERVHFIAVKYAHAERRFIIDKRIYFV